MRYAAGVALLILLACSRAMPPSTDTPVVMNEASPRATLPIPSNSGRLVIDIRDVVNPDLAPVTITATDDGSPAAVQRFTLFPPDQPARFAIRVSPNATKLLLSLAPSSEPGAPRVAISATVRPATATSD